MGPAALLRWTFDQQSVIITFRRECFLITELCYFQGSVWKKVGYLCHGFELHGVIACIWHQQCRLSLCGGEALRLCTFSAVRECCHRRLRGCDCTEKYGTRRHIPPPEKAVHPYSSAPAGNQLCSWTQECPSCHIAERCTPAHGAALPWSEPTEQFLLDAMFPSHWCMVYGSVWFLLWIFFLHC